MIFELRWFFLFELVFFFPYLKSQFVKPLPSHAIISGSPQKGCDTSNFSRIILYLRKFFHIMFNSTSTSFSPFFQQHLPNASIKRLPNAFFAFKRISTIEQLLFDTESNLLEKVYEVNLPGGDCRLIRKDKLSVSSAFF